MFRRYIPIFLIILMLFTAACGKNEPSDTFGECIISSKYEELTQEEYTEYMQTAYGLDTLEAQTVYHSNGHFQMDFLFSEDVEDWQIESAQKYAVDKFYSRSIAKYDLRNYDTWLIEHMDEESESVTYRIFVGQDLVSAGTYPDS